MNQLVVSVVLLIITCVATPLNAQISNEYIEDIVEHSVALVCRSEKQLKAYKIGYQEAVDCIKRLSSDTDLNSFITRNVSKLDLNSCTDSTKITSQELHIAAPVHHSDLDVKLADLTVNRGIDAVVLETSESGGTSLTLIRRDGRMLEVVHSKEVYSEALRPFDGYYRDRIAFLLEVGPENKQAKLIKRAIISILDEKS